jgi:hypothetical protein
MAIIPSGNFYLVSGSETAAAVIALIVANGHGSLLNGVLRTTRDIAVLTGGTLTFESEQIIFNGSLLGMQASALIVVNGSAGIVLGLFANNSSFPTVGGSKAVYPWISGAFLVHGTLSVVYEVDSIAEGAWLQGLASGEGTIRICSNNSSAQPFVFWDPTLFQWGCRLLVAGQFTAQFGRGVHVAPEWTEAYLASGAPTLLAGSGLDSAGNYIVLEAPRWHDESFNQAGGTLDLRVVPSGRAVVVRDAQLPSEWNGELTIDTSAGIGLYQFFRTWSVGFFDASGSPLSGIHAKVYSQANEVLAEIDTDSSGYPVLVDDLEKQAALGNMTEERGAFIKVFGNDSVGGVTVTDATELRVVARQYAHRPIEYILAEVSDQELVSGGPLDGIRVLEPSEAQLAEAAALALPGIALTYSSPPGTVGAITAITVTIDRTVDQLFDFLHATLCQPSHFLTEYNIGFDGERLQLGSIDLTVDEAQLSNGEVETSGSITLVRGGFIDGFNISGSGPRTPMTITRNAPWSGISILNEVNVRVGGRGPGGSSSVFHYTAPGGSSGDWTILTSQAGYRPVLRKYKVGLGDAISLVTNPVQLVHTDGSDKYKATTSPNGQVDLTQLAAGALVYRVSGLVGVQAIFDEIESALETLDGLTYLALGNEKPDLVLREDGELELIMRPGQSIIRDNPGDTGATIDGCVSIESVAASPINTANGSVAVLCRIQPPGIDS